MLNVAPSRAKGESSYEVPGFTIIRNIPPDYAESIFTAIAGYLQDTGEMLDFDGKRSINKDRIYLATLLIEYSDRSLLESDKESNSQLKMKNIIQSEPIDGVRQLWESIWDFEWNGKHYLVVYTYNTLTDETLPERWVFRWVIVDKQKYDLTRPHADEVCDTIRDRTKGTLNID